MNDVTIVSFDTIGEDARGLTASFNLPREQQDFIFLTRCAGSISGNTYHKGKNVGTNPKTFLLLRGKIKFSYRNIQTDMAPITKDITAPAKIEVKPYVTHQVEVVEDATFLECNSIADIQTDRVKSQVFEG